MNGGLCHLRGDVGRGADVITLPIRSVTLPALFGGQCVSHLNWCDFSFCFVVYCLFPPTVLSLRGTGPLLTIGAVVSAPRVVSGTGQARASSFPSIRGKGTVHLENKEVCVNTWAYTSVR